MCSPRVGGAGGRAARARPACTSGSTTSKTRIVLAGAACGDGLLAGDPSASLRRQLQPARQDARSPRRSSPSIPSSGPRCEISRPSAKGRRSTSTSSSPGPTCRTLADFSDKLRDRVAPSCPAWSTSTPRCAWTSRTCWPTSTANGRPRSASTCSEIADTLRVAVGGDDRVSRYLRRAGRRRLRRRAAAGGRRPRRSRDSISQLYVRAMQPAAENDTESRRRRLAPMPLISGLGYDGRSSPLTRIDNVVRFEETFSPSRIDRLDRQRMAGDPREPRARLRAGRRHRTACNRRPTSWACRPATRPASWAGARELERTLARIRLDLRPVVHLHVHRARRAVRAPDPPDHDSAFAADRRAVRPVQPVARRRNAQPLLGAGHPRAVRHGEEGVDPAGRPHQPAPHGRHAARPRRSSKATATACGRS